MTIIRNKKGQFEKGNSYWLGRVGKKSNKGSFTLGLVPWNKGKRTYKKCERCGIKFTTNKGNLTKPHQRFCSRSCAVRTGRNWAKCSICGKQSRHYETKFCQKCYTNENHHWWKGGITPINLHIRTSDKYKQWRKKVFERDNFTCRECGKNKIPIEAHHIKPFYKYKNLRLIINNGITLCASCHIKIDKYRGRHK